MYLVTGISLLVRRNNDAFSCTYALLSRISSRSPAAHSAGSRYPTNTYVHIYVSIHAVFTHTYPTTITPTYQNTGRTTPRQKNQLARNPGQPGQPPRTSHPAVRNPEGWSSVGVHRPMEKAIEGVEAGREGRDYGSKLALGGSEETGKSPQLRRRVF